jgi:hypothetical protein
MSREVLGTDRSPGAEDGPAENIAWVEEEEAPTGTLFFMVIFLLLMVGLWATVYWMLLNR